MAAASHVAVRAHGKINLDLRLLGRRRDGYHEVATVLQAIALHDTVIVRATRGSLELRGDASKMPLDESNLAWRAAGALWRAAGKSGAARGACIAIRKRLPPAAGLGGGSSDAAAALVALNRVWRLGLPLADLADVAAGLGSDVPFFLVGGTALGLGRGERLFPLTDLPPHPVVVAWPERGVSTSEAYSWVTPPKPGTAPKTGTVPNPGGNRGLSPNVAEWTAEPNMLGILAGRFHSLHNDLQDPVEARRPEIAEIRRALEDLGALVARMSGSGSASFGLFATAAAAARAARALRVKGWQAVATSTSGRGAQAGRLAGHGRVV